MGLAPPGRLGPFRVVSSTCPSLPALPLGLGVGGRGCWCLIPDSGAGVPSSVCVKSYVCVCASLLQDSVCVCVKSSECVPSSVCLCGCVCVRARACVRAPALARLFATELRPPASLLAEMLLVRRAACVCTSEPVWEDEEFSRGFYALHSELCFSAQKITFWVVTGQIFAWILTASPTTLAYRLG